LAILIKEKSQHCAICEQKDQTNNQLKLLIMQKIKNIHTVFLVSLVCGSCATAIAQQQLSQPYGNIPLNYVRTWDATAPEQDDNNLPSKSLRDVKQTTVYLDGLGRPLQTIVRKGSLTTDPVNPGSSSAAVDMISPVVYDVLGREQYKYLPFASTATDASKNTGLFKSNPFQQQVSFYNTQLSGQTGETNVGTDNLNWAYSKTVFDGSPFDRVAQNFAAGSSWVGNNVGAGVTYEINVTSEVRIWNISGSGLVIPVSPGWYDAGMLYRTFATDEHGKRLVEYRDKEGKIILKKVEIKASGSAVIASHTDWLNTYYVYDELKNLRFVIPPKAVDLLSTGWTFGTTVFNSSDIAKELCFVYDYDQYNRISLKKAPGAAEVYMVYDQRDRLVMMQDGNMRASNTWLVTKYDELNRPVENGTWISPSSQATHQVNALTTYPYPATSSGYELMALTHYDDYVSIPGGLTATFDNSWSAHFNSTYDAPPDYAQQQTVSTHTRGLVTWTQIKILGTVSDYIYSLNIYDDKKRVIQVKTKNSTSGTDLLTTQYNWSGQPLIIVTKTEKAGALAQTSEVITKWTYDDLGRVLKIEKKLRNTLVNSNAWTAYTTIAENEYNALGQLKKKKLGTKPGAPAGTPLAKLENEYNIRGWLLAINKGYITASSNSDQYFGLELGYDKNASLGTFSPQYTGNISGTIWKAEGDQQKRKYDFTYDPASRLTGADFNQYVSGTGSSATFNKSANIDFSISNLTYDANGNILTMDQKGLKLNSSSLIDQLGYTYQTNSNKLLKVIDGNTGADNGKLGDFKDGANGSDDYNYDVNGNLTLDNNKAISSITYNHLDRPTVITVTGKGIITYTYDAAGNKLKKVTQENGATVFHTGTNYTTNITTTTLYLGDGVYESKAYSHASLASLQYTDQLQFIGHEEGRIRFVKGNENNCPVSTDRFVFDYFLKDHLGNVRTFLTEQKEDICYIPATVEDASYQGEDDIYNIVNGRRIDKTTTGATQSSFGNKLYKTHGNVTNEKTGLGAVLKVMAGDQIRITVESFYTMPGGGAGSNYSLGLSELLTSFVSSSTILSSSHSGITTTDVSNAGSVGTTTLGNFISNNNPPANTARAFVNWILFDEQFKFVAGNSDPVATSGGYKLHTEFINTPANITRNGYLYIYVSNENNFPVYFDNLAITHSPGAILEETHYYPFGLTMKGISSKSLTGIENKFKFNDGTELANNEFSDGSGLELYETPFRGYDPQIGRFWQIDAMADDYASWSPYTFALDNPMFFNDPSGLASEPPGETSTHDNPKALQEVVVKASYKNKWNYTNWAIFVDLNKNHDQVALNKYLKNQGVDDRGLTLFNKAWTGIGYRERLAEIEASWRSFVQAALLEGATWVAGGVVFKVAGKLIKVGYRGYKLYQLRQGEKGAQYLYHYTSEAAANSIRKNGLNVGKDGFSYLTNNPNLSALQAQIELALPANRALPTSLIKINVTGLNPALVRRVTGNMPGMGAGGGTEFLFNQTIPSNLIQVIK
jgi:RHS repeat-associated protein